MTERERMEDKVQRLRRGSVRRAAEEIDLFALARALWNGRWWIAGSGLAGLIGGLLYAYVVATPLYMATAVVALERLSPTIFSARAPQLNPSAEIELIRSRNVLDPVIMRLGLAADPEFNSAVPLLPEENSARPPATGLTLLAVNEALDILSVGDAVFRIAATTEEPYKSAALANAVAETFVARPRPLADAQVISPAVPPLKTVLMPNAVMAAIGAVGGLMLGMGGVLARELTRTSVRTVEELEAATGYAVLGTLPAETPMDLSAPAGPSVISPRLVEAIRSLRTTLDGTSDRSPHCVLIVSSNEGEGKTGLGLALASSYGAIGRRTVLMEADIRRPHLAAILGLANAPGLPAALEGVEVLDVVRAAGPRLPGIDVLTSGPDESSRLADALASERLTAIMRALEDTYDVVLVDAPPVLAVSDALVLSRRCDAVIYAVHCNGTDREEISEGLHLLETVGARIAGLVLIGIDAG